MVSTTQSGRWAGYATAGCAFLYALTSFYWGSGGTFALDTVGREAVRLIEAGDPGIHLAVWFAGVVKVAGGVLASMATSTCGARGSSCGAFSWASPPSTTTAARDGRLTATLRRRSGPRATP
ncbi:DUF3995 domain-containing protein [Actinokineospora sp. HBU206404]|uniref:DUF3995 domain-containing protein n=1 Tax=Actinokineospora xionganensis TaxID=2684470 RepID=A0ABR7L2A3_9PSEU|nr:DUF3995 domain-containing protein [Actinokineospora xionganensis]